MRGRCAMHRGSKSRADSSKTPKRGTASEPDASIRGKFPAYQVSCAALAFPAPFDAYEECVRWRKCGGSKPFPADCSRMQTGTVGETCGLLRRKLSACRPPSGLRAKLFRESRLTTLLCGWYRPLCHCHQDRPTGSSRDQKIGLEQLHLPTIPFPLESSYTAPDRS